MNDTKHDHLTQSLCNGIYYDGIYLKGTHFNGITYRICMTKEILGMSEIARLCRQIELECESDGIAGAVH